MYTHVAPRWKNEIITLTNHFDSRDLEIRSRSLNVKFDLQISVMYMRWKNEGFESRRYEVIALTSSHYVFRDLVTLKLGQGHWMSNFTYCHTHEVKKWRSYKVIALTSICTVRPLACPPARRTARSTARPPLVITIPYSLNGCGVRMI